MKENDVEITIKYHAETDSISVNVKGSKGYSETLGIIEHGKMQMFCAYNEDYFKKGMNDDDIFE